VTPEDFGWSREAFDNLTDFEKNELVQDWGIGLEVEAELTYNPVALRAAEVWDVAGGISDSFRFLTFPEIPDEASIETRIRMIRNALYEGILFRSRRAIVARFP